MPDREEIVRSIFGAWRLAHLDTTGMQYFNLSFEGFFRSFFVAVLIAPFYAIQVALQTGEVVDLMHLVIVKAFVYALGWVIFPLVLAILGRIFNLGESYVPFIVAYNWCQVILTAFWLPLTVVLAQDMLGRDLGTLLFLLAFAATYAFVWFIARTALRTNALTAAGVTVVSLVIDLALIGLDGKI
jgi:hypothetical protein